jgi:Legionella pneumophila major outer membrane protein precursor
MHLGRRRGHIASRFAPAVLAVLAALAIATPTRAADSDYKGWFAALDVAMTQPNSLDQHYATEIDSSFTNANHLVMENDSDLTWKASVGYGFGKGLGSLQVSYWSFDNEDKQAGTETAGYLYPSIFGYGYRYGGMYINNYPIDFAAASKVKASTIDVDYIRPIAVGEKFAVKWLAGLRIAHYEEDQAFDALDAAGYEYIQTKHLESDGNGLRVGVTGVFGFGKHFSLEASMAASFMQADTKGDSGQAFIDTIGGVNSETRHAEDDYIRGEIRDYDLKAVWNYGHLDYFVGYSQSDWDGMPVDPLPANGCCGGAADNTARNRESVSFNSLHGGVVWRFGKSH